MTKTQSAVTSTLVLAGAVAGAVLSGCTRTACEPPRTSYNAPSTEPATSPPPSAAPAPEQATIDKAATVLESMRKNPNFLGLNAYLAQARGVMIFPKVYKGAFIVGGQGGTGVLVSREPNGKWSAPAFYTLGAGSAGLQFGYEEASVVLVFMTDSALRSAVNRGLTLGADATIAAGTMGNASASSSGNTTKDIYEFVEAGGVFAGISLDGTVVDSRESQNREYYGANASAAGIVLEHRFDRPETAVLKQALSRAS